MQIENDVERYLVTQAKKENWLCLKFVSPGNAGVPDRLLIRSDGVLIFVELKRGGAFDPRPLQQYWLDKLIDYRQRTFVMRSKDDVDYFFRNWG